MDLVLCIALCSLFAFSTAIAWSASAHRREMLSAVGSPGPMGRSVLARASSWAGRLARSRLPRLFRPERFQNVARHLNRAGLAYVDPSGFVLVSAAFGATASSAAFALADSSRFESALLAGAAAVTTVLLRLRTLARRRREAVEREAPFALDLLTLSVEAGLDLAQAISRVAQRTRGLVSQELAKADASMRMGARRQEAIRLMADSLCVPSLTTLAALLAQSEKLGAGVAPLLRAASERIREERFARAERCGAIASQKMLLPLIVFIMPSTFIVVFGPIFVRLALGGAEALF